MWNIGLINRYSFVVYYYYYYQSLYLFFAHGYDCAIDASKTHMNIIYEWGDSSPLFEHQRTQIFVTCSSVDLRTMRIAIILTSLIKRCFGKWHPVHNISLLFFCSPAQLLKIVGTLGFGQYTDMPRLVGRNY
jgi:hypothetical protein